MIREWFTRLIVLTACLLAPTSSLWACPMCKLALESDDPQPRAYMTSILFMLGTVMTMFGSVAGLLCWVSRHERRALTDAGYDHLFENGVSGQSSVVSDKEINASSPLTTDQ